MILMLHDNKPTLEEALEHFGVKGMHWGVRKELPTYSSTVDHKAIGSPIVNMDKRIHTTGQDAAYQVSALLKDRYGFEVKEVNAITERRYKNYFAYVEAPNGKTNTGNIFVQPRNLNPDLAKTETKGWFGPGCGNIRATMTHETAHSMFHAQEKSEGFFRPKVTGGNIQARQKAYKAAVAAAKADGIKERDFAKHISGYANATIWREETEAELFSRYHWSKSNPRFIDVWGKTLHKEMNVDPTPFRQVVKDG